MQNSQDAKLPNYCQNCHSAAASERTGSMDKCFLTGNNRKPTHCGLAEEGYSRKCCKLVLRPELQRFVVIKLPI